MECTGSASSLWAGSFAGQLIGVYGEGQNLKVHDPVYDNQEFGNFYCLVACMRAMW